MEVCSEGGGGFEAVGWRGVREKGEKEKERERERFRVSERARGRGRYRDTEG